MEKKKQAISRKTTFIGTKSDASKCLTVSRQTQNFIDCLRALEAISTKVNDALMVLFDDAETVENFMEVKYNEQHNELFYAITELVTESVTHNVCEKKFTEI